jgi:hypothetical protein
LREHEVELATVVTAQAYPRTHPQQPFRVLGIARHATVLHLFARIVFGALQ